MILRMIAALLLAGGALLAEPGRLTGDGPANGPANGTTAVMMLPLNEQRVVQVPTHPTVAIMLQFPDAITDYAGRGFSEDPQGVAGEFFLRWVSGDTYLVVTPLVAGARATLHVVVGGRSYPIHFFPADPAQAWAKVIFEVLGRQTGAEGNGTGSPAEAMGPPAVDRSFVPPKAQRPLAPSTERLLGILDTLRLVRSLPEAQGWALVAANPALSLSRRVSVQPQGKYTLTIRAVLRNQLLDAVAFGVTLENMTGDELRFDPSSLVVRAGHHVYATSAADFDPILAPHESTELLFAIVNDGSGGMNFLTPDNDFRISLAEAAPVPPSPRTLP